MSRFSAYYIFLPAMFFSNGGAEGGTPIWLLLGTMYIAMVLEGKFKFIMLAFEGLVLTACWIVGYYYPSLVTEYPRVGNFFDSLDGRFHVKEDEIKTFLYYEYCEIDFDGKVDDSGVRKTELSSLGKGAEGLSHDEYIIKAVKVKDHIQIDIINAKDTRRIIAALPDSTRYAYIGLSGTHCRISSIRSERSENEVESNHIQRIAEEISYINVPAGDIPNIQIDGYRFESTAGIPVRDGMKISFHTKSLPTARLVWHCPSYVIFSSDDGKVSGTNYNEFSLVRLDGEYWDVEGIADNELIVDRHGFNGWDSWKNYNKQGYDCTITFERNGNKIISYTENAGISIKNVIQIKIETKEVYVALSGDQVALTGIKIS